MNKVLKFVSSATLADYVAVDAIHHFQASGAAVQLYVIGRGADVAVLDTITISTTTAAQAQTCADKLAQVMTAVHVTKATPLVIDTNFSDGVTGIAYAVV